MALVEADHSAWLEYIKQLRAAAERANEASIYQTLAEAPDSFRIAIGEAKNACDDLVTAKLNLELHIARLLRQIEGKGRRHDLTGQVCAFCSEPHWADTCPRFTTLKERFDRARQLRLCFKCLRKGHNQKDYTRNVYCHHCKRKGHPTAPCKTWHRSQQEKEENPVGETHTQAIRTVSAIETPEQQEQDRTVLHLSTFVEVRGDAPHTKTIKVPVLFDVGFIHNGRSSPAIGH
uniref:CCHC-type domain-containing protein n=1 Tax=Parascaris univalens TaxID=6257 RepID=A0A914ZYR1_PARUN